MHEFTVFMYLLVLNDKQQSQAANVDCDTYDLNDFKSRINRQHLTVGSF